MATFRQLILAGALGAGLFAGGCTSDDHDHHSSRDYDRYDSTRVSRSGRDVERDSGAARGLPRDARLIEETRGGTLAFTARDSGTVYLYDATARTVIWDGHARNGDRVRVNPDKNRIQINGKDQADIDLKSDHRFEMYIDTGSSRSRY